MSMLFPHESQNKYGIILNLYGKYIHVQINLNSSMIFTK